MDENQTSDDDDVPQLSAETFAALQEFYAEQAQLEQQLTPAEKGDAVNAVSADRLSMPSEDWQLSQFWYDENTASLLAQEVLAAAEDNGRIACISCPTLYTRLRNLDTVNHFIVCLEYDNRFSAFGSDFIHYDYNEPLNIPAELRETFDIVVADPPFLSEECLRKTAATVKFLTKKRVLLCTGAIMADVAREALEVRECSFQPRHANNLANEFRCFANYETLVLDRTNSTTAS